MFIFYNTYIYSHPQIDGKVNHHQISRDLLFHLFGDDYNDTLNMIGVLNTAAEES